MNNSVGLRAEFGGRWFLDRKLLLITLPYLLTTSLLSNLVQLSQNGSTFGNITEILSSLVLANISSFLGCWIVIEIFNATLLRNKNDQPIHIALVLTVSFFVGAIKGLITGQMAIFLGVFDPLTEAASNRWLQTGFLGIALIPMAAVIASKIEQVKRNREILLAERVDQITKNEMFDSTHQLSRLVNLKINSNELLMRAKFRLEKPQVDPKIVVEDFVYELVDGHIRPLSHQIWKSQKRGAPSFSWSWALHEILRWSPASWASATGLIGLTFFIGHLQIFSLEISVFKSLIITFFASIASMLHLAFPNLSERRKLLIFLVSALLGMVLGTLVGDSLTETSNAQSYWLFVIDGWLLVIQNLAAVPLAFSILRVQKETNLELNKGLSSKQMDIHADRLINELRSRDFAQYLHSDVQNKLLATALIPEIENASDAKRILNNLGDLIQNLELLPSDSRSLSWIEFEIELKDRWAGFVAIDMKIDEIVQQKVVPDQNTMEIVNETITNAVRHGMASSIKISLNYKDSATRFNLVVTDDGIGPKRGRPGMGTRLIEASTQGRWSLEAMETGGTKLECDLMIPKAKH